MTDHPCFRVLGALVVLAAQEHCVLSRVLGQVSDLGTCQEPFGVSTFEAIASLCVGLAVVNGALWEDMQEGCRQDGCCGGLPLTSQSFSSPEPTASGSPLKAPAADGAGAGGDLLWAGAGCQATCRTTGMPLTG